MIPVPLRESVDVLIVGMSTGAVEAALVARERGMTVLMVSHFTYPGEDFCAFSQYWSSDERLLQTDLGKTLFSSDFEKQAPPTPMHIKYTLETALIQQGVDFMYMTYPVLRLQGDQGQTCGLVVANRSGFQAIPAKHVIDATHHGLVGRWLDADAVALKPGTVELERIVIGGEPIISDDFKTEELPGLIRVRDNEFQAYRHTITTRLQDDTPTSIFAAEVEARLATFHPDQVASSDYVYFKTPTPERCGDVLMLTGAGQMQEGRELVGQLDSNAVLPDQLEVAYSADAVNVEVRRADRYFRLADLDTIAVDLRRVQAYDPVDLLVVGGGTAGAPAGISGARQGINTLVCETTRGLGGVGTEGRISAYWYGNRVGFTAEIDAGVEAIGAETDQEFRPGRWNIEWKKHWYLRELHRAGGQVWFGSMALATAVEQSVLKGALIATPQGCGLVGAARVLDATGNADLARSAGAETVSIKQDHVAVQGTGLPPVIPVQHYTNTDHTFVDDSDNVDVTRSFSVARKKFQGEYDLGQLVDSRERETIVGEYTVDPGDIMLNKQYTDTVVTAMSNFDTHGFTVHPLFTIEAPPSHRESLSANIPYRSLLPQGAENVLVLGLGISAHRDAMPVLRMQADVQNQGYVAGYAAAISLDDDKTLRQVDMHRLQDHLVEVGRT